MFMYIIGHKPSIIEDYMQVSILLAKVAGAILLALTIRSIVKHLKTLKIVKHSEQSFVEQSLNNILLYVWLIFMIAFSVGLIVNN